MYQLYGATFTLGWCLNTSEIKPTKALSPIYRPNKFVMRPLIGVSTITLKALDYSVTKFYTCHFHNDGTKNKLSKNNTLNLCTIFNIN